jgi:hypothetical protein
MSGKVKRGLIYLAGLVVAFLLLDIPHLNQPILNLNKPAIIKERHATWEEKRENKEIARQYAWVAFGWKGREWFCLHDLWTAESRFDHTAKNQQGSSAYGIAQLLGERSRDPRIQILRGLRYIDDRYGTPCKAKRFHLRFNHY